MVSLQLSYISPNEKDYILTDIVLKFFLPSVRDLAKIVASKIFKHYLFRIMSREWSEWDQTKYRLALAEISLHDQAMVLEFEHVLEENKDQREREGNGVSGKHKRVEGYDSP